MTLNRPTNPRVVLYRGLNCHLCERARTTLTRLREELDFELEEVTIDGDPALEAAYREWIPVVELDGERVCTYYVQEGPLRRRIVTAQSPASETSL
jgi:glutaredoxin